MNNYQDYSLIPVIQELEKLFGLLNKHFFDGTLQPALIIASTQGRKSAYGWCTGWKAWTSNDKKNIHSVNPTQEERAILNEEDGYYEINICAEYLSRPFDEVAGTLLHEMVHLFCLQLGIKDTSRNGAYHNKTFKRIAEERGLEVDKDTRAGWCKTELKYESRLYVESIVKSGEINREVFDLHRRSMKVKTETKKPGMRKYVCPTCGATIRSSREVEVRCIKCDQRFEYIIPEDELPPAKDNEVDPEKMAELDETLVPEIAAVIADVDEIIDTANAS